MRIHRAYNCPFKTAEGMSETPKENRGCGRGCLIMICVFAGIVLLFIIIGKIIDYRICRHAPDWAEYVEEFAEGVEFPPYEFVSYEWIGPQFPDYHNRTTFRFNEVPDSGFYMKLDSLCRIAPWRFKDGRWRYYYPENDSLYNEHMMELGFPKDLVPSIGEYYEITIPRDSLEWTMDSWCI